MPGHFWWFLMFSTNVHQQCFKMSRADNFVCVIFWRIKGRSTVFSRKFTTCQVVLNYILYSRKHNSSELQNSFPFIYFCTQHIDAKLKHESCIVGRFSLNVLLIFHSFQALQRKSNPYVVDAFRSWPLWSQTGSKLRQETTPDFRKPPKELKTKESLYMFLVLAQE